jgi:hypothetical protein
MRRDDGYGAVKTNNSVVLMRALSPDHHHYYAVGYGPRDWCERQVKEIDKAREPIVVAYEAMHLTLKLLNG